MTPEPTRAGGAAVDALLDPGFLEAAVQRPMADVRRLRRQAEQEEVNLSYTRRLLQGRLDIVRREPRRARLDAAVNDSFGFGGHNIALVFTTA